MEINEEGKRVLLNLAQHYDAWLEATRLIARGRLAWKASGGKDYLYRIVDRQGNGTSLGPRSTATEALHGDYERARHGQAQTGTQLATDHAIYRALRLPQPPSFIGAALRELDVRGLLGSAYLVVGTSALSAYAIETGTILPTELSATADLDVTWIATGGAPEPNALFAALKAADGTYAVNTERPFQLRNARGEEVELLLPASLAGRWSSAEKLHPVPLPEQDWLLKGRPITHVVCDLGGGAARLVVPDPRRYALHKLWLADKPGRSRLKVDKDRGQGATMLDLVADRMPHYPLDDAFRGELPTELRPYFDSWATRRRVKG